MQRFPAHAPLDRRIGELAAAQHGLITRAQLGALGLGPGGVEYRLGVGRLYRVHRGVYTVGTGSLSPEGRWLAAVLACGEGAALSHASAAALWGIRESGSASIDVTVKSRAGRDRRNAIRIHRSTSLTDVEVTRRLRIPVTTPARTLMDLAGILSPASLRRAVAKAEARRVFDLRALSAVLDANPRRKGTGVLERLVAEWRDGDELLRSDLESLVLELCRSEGLPRPLANTFVHGYEVDFLWSSRKLIAEADGGEHHRTRSAFEADRIRDACLTAAGYRVVRFTYRQVTHDPAYVAGVLRTLVR
jgi:hypothetical protein